MGKSEKKKHFFVRNQYGLLVMMCCASCKYKEICRTMTTRHCKLKNKEVKPLDVCKNWEINEALARAGKTRGVVRDKDTKEVVIG